MKKDYVFMFDFDGVIANTPHEQAWKAAAIDYGIISDDFNFTPFYVEEVAGEPGKVGSFAILSKLADKGQRTFFEKYGELDAEIEVEKFRTKKNELTQKLIEEDNWYIYDDIKSVIYDVHNLKSECQENKIVAVSSSQNAEYLLNKSREFKGIFDEYALDAIKTWNGRRIPKMAHYAMAYGKILAQCEDKSRAPEVVVFEDAPKGIEAVAELGFKSIGIVRTSYSGEPLSSKKELYDAGATVVYEEKELQEKNLRNVILDLYESTQIK